MDPNPKTFPLVSYVLTRINSTRNPNADSFPPSAGDIESSPLTITTSSPKWTADQVDLMSRMPHLNHPELLASMTRAISDVAQTRSILRNLGSRPDHEEVDTARLRIAEIDREMEMEIADGGGVEKEEECRKRKEKEKEKQGFRALIRLDEMHEAYENLLRDAEERLVGIYGEKATAESEGEEVLVEMNEEVVELLKDSSDGKCFEKVDLSGRQLRALPEDIGRIRGLVVLNLSNNQLEVIPDSIAGLQQLEELRLSKNTLTCLPDSTGLLLSLKILNVSGNKLKRLPDSISYCRSLVELDTSYNEITYLPTNIGFELVNLQKLMIHLNKIRSLPTSICEMTSLRQLDAHFNELRSLPRAMGKLTKLEILDLSSNFSDLTELPETFGDLINLRELDLSNNQILALPDNFGCLKNLVKLNMDQNPITIPPSDVINKGIEAVLKYMDTRLVEIIQYEEAKRAMESQTESRSGWLTRSGSLLNWVSGVSGYLGAGQKSERDSYLDQEL